MFADKGPGVTPVVFSLHAARHIVIATLLLSLLLPLQAVFLSASLSRSRSVVLLCHWQRPLSTARFGSSATTAKWKFPRVLTFRLNPIVSLYFASFAEESGDIEPVRALLALY